MGNPLPSIAGTLDFAAKHLFFPAEKPVASLKPLKAMVA